MTLLEIVNKVLLKLREPVVTDLSADYSKLVASFVGDAHRLVADHHNWSALDTSVVVTLATGTTEYELYTGAGAIQSGTAPNRKSTVRMDDRDMPLAYLYASTGDVSTGTALHQMSLGDTRWIKRQLRTRAGYTARPSAFSITPNVTNDGWTLRLDTDPDTTYYLLVEFNKPESDLTETVAATTFKVPWEPVYEGALMFALNERGEELGEPGNTAEKRFTIALDLAKETDVLQSARPDSNEMYRD